MAQGYDTNVFINCPFDSQYRPLFEAVTFTGFSFNTLLCRSSASWR